MDLSSKEQAAGAISDALLPRLKRDTQASYLALESHINLTDRVRTAAGYGKLLEAFYGLVAPIEERLGHHQSEIVAWIPDIQNKCEPLYCGATCVCSGTCRRKICRSPRSPHMTPWRTRWAACMC
jgi:hypothetical protein